MHTETDHTFLPVALNITGKRILLIGGGRVGLHKATILSRYTREATVISPTFREEFQALPFTLVRKPYAPSDLRGAFLVYVCTEDEALNRQVKADAEAMGILVSVCDNPPLCDFISPAIYRDGPISIAVTSNAREVRRSIRIRDRIKAWIEAHREMLE
jgi:siroheme synthase-like protein